MVTTKQTPTVQKCHVSATTAFGPKMQKPAEKTEKVEKEEEASSGARARRRGWGQTAVKPEEEIAEERST